MTEKVKELKINGYDKFKCIADKCKYTCCSGWDINVDSETFNKWSSEKEECSYILDFAINIDNDEYIINKKTHDNCPFLNKEKLCEIVIKNGDEYLSSTCASFPRMQKQLENVSELTLSCACPEVVDIMSNFKINELTFNNILSKEEESIEFAIRNTILNIIKMEEILLEERLEIVYTMLTSIYDIDELTEDKVIDIIEHYNNEFSLGKFNQSLNSDNAGLKDSLKKLNSLFLDIIENYKRVPLFKNRLSNIYFLAIQRKYLEQIEKWNEFNEKFKEFSALITKIVIVKILNSCLNDDVGEILISFQEIILEYICLKYAVFLNNLSSVELNEELIKEYIVIFSRVIGNNTEAVLDFLNDQYGSEILDVKYIKILLNRKKY